ncbi:IMP dehydrogenase [Mycolicibacterium fortuitum]|uniref:zinc-dependent alcohol dehydrogenase family protein n=1 Tax=Mycolicibacterium fortuitum TaxID=1766 RepID=UPI0007EA2EF2|nr:zinc-dependent alcohol dehydrogenase family protein [Mycolicibacterium fortuitum]OBG47685.1 IMP dehydrogenase [Mycolicibacterium fortuitum]
MRGTVIYGPGDVRYEELPDPTILAPTDAIVRNSATCVCGSDLWDYRGINPISAPRAFGHEYCGVVEAVGSEVASVTPGQFVIGSFIASDNTCPNCRYGIQTSCQHRQLVTGCQSELVRIPMADGTLVALSDQPDDDQIPDLLALSDVMGTGWHAAEAAGVDTGMTVAVVGDGAVGLCAVLAARERGAERIIIMSRNESRQRLALAFGATDVVTERGKEGVAAIKEVTAGVGADAIMECVGTAESMQQAIDATRPGGNVGFVGVPHDIGLRGERLFRSHVGLRGGLAPVRQYLPRLIALVLAGRIQPGKVFDLELPLDQVAQAYRAMDERTAIKVLLRPSDSLIPA